MLGDGQPRLLPPHTSPLAFTVKASPFCGMANPGWQTANLASGRPNLSPPIGKHNMWVHEQLVMMSSDRGERSRENHILFI